MIPAFAPHPSNLRENTHLAAGKVTQVRSRKGDG